MTGTACAWCGTQIEIEVDADHGGLCEACEEAVGEADTAWRQQEGND